jgi:hypothetical protein
MDVTGANAFWNEYNTPGVGMPAAGGSDLVSFIWAPVGTPDLLYSVGSQFGQRGGSPLDQGATKGVTAVDSTPGAAYSTLSTMLSDGWNLAYDIDSGVKYGAPTGLAVSISLSGPYNQYSLIYNQSEPFELQGAPSISGAQIEVIVLAWNASSGTNAILNGSMTDLGWSNPFKDTVGSSESDPNAGEDFTAAGMNQFGVAAAPEPPALALAGAGGLTLYFARRRKAQFFGRRG